jgi:ADP-ribosyl-[dinitrogen reductase] hydrolase
MLALLDSLTSIGFDVDDQAKRAVAWMDGPDYKPGARFDIGGTTSRALNEYKRGIPASQRGGRSENSSGNGGLMRILPVALVGGDSDPEDAVTDARRRPR